MARTDSKQLTGPGLDLGGKRGMPAMPLMALGVSLVAILWAVGLLTEQGRLAYAYTFVFVDFFGGVFALIGMTLAVMVGVAVTDRMILTPKQRVFIQSAHRTLGIFAVTWLVIHVVVKVAEGRASAIGLGIPFLLPAIDGQSVVFMAMGPLAAWLMVFAMWNGMVRRRWAGSGRPWMWRVLHSTAYLSWGFGLLHGLGVGRPGAPWVNIAYIVCVGLTLVLLLFRLAAGRNRRTQKARLATTTMSTTSMRPVGKVSSAARRRAELDEESFDAEPRFAGDTNFAIAPLEPAGPAVTRAPEPRPAPRREPERVTRREPEPQRTPRRERLEPAMASRRYDDAPPPGYDDAPPPRRRGEADRPASRRRAASEPPPARTRSARHTGDERDYSPEARGDYAPVESRGDYAPVESRGRRARAEDPYVADQPYSPAAGYGPPAPRAGRPIDDEPPMRRGQRPAPRRRDEPAPMEEPPLRAEQRRPEPRRPQPRRAEPVVADDRGYRATAPAPPYIPVPTRGSEDAYIADMAPADDTPTLVNLASRRAARNTGGQDREAVRETSVRSRRADGGAKRRRGSDKDDVDEDYWGYLRGEAQ